MRPLKVLIADDNKFTRTIYGNSFEKRGHTVVTATNGDECLSKYKTEWLTHPSGSKTFDAVILDYSMPVINGDEVVPEILRMNPGQSILISSAWDADKLKIAFYNHKDSIEIIQKGFPIEALVEKVEAEEGK